MPSETIAGLALGVRGAVSLCPDAGKTRSSIPATLTAPLRRGGGIICCSASGRKRMVEARIEAGLLDLRRLRHRLRARPQLALAPCSSPTVAVVFGSTAEAQNASVTALRSAPLCSHQPLAAAGDPGAASSAGAPAMTDNANSLTAAPLSCDTLVCVQPSTPNHVPAAQGPLFCASSLSARPAPGQPLPGSGAGRQAGPVGMARPRATVRPDAPTDATNNSAGRSPPAQPPTIRNQASDLLTTHAATATPATPTGPSVPPNLIDFHGPRGRGTSPAVGRVGTGRTRQC